MTFFREIVIKRLNSNIVCLGDEIPDIFLTKIYFPCRTLPVASQTITRDPGSNGIRVKIKPLSDLSDG
jgi:hypothetical protein